jgi:hypothetical protein
MEEQKIPTLIYRLDVKRPVELLRALFNMFSSDQTLISFEGDLSQFDPRGIQVIFQTPLDVLSPNAVSPKGGKVVILMNSAARESFEQNILPRAGIHNRIWYILITVSDETVFASYDYFSDGCVWVTASVSEEWLNTLVESKIIKGFHITKSSKSEIS